MPNLRVSKEEAMMQLTKVSHLKFQNSLKEGYWKVNERHVEAKSVCWLYCWGRTGNHSTKTAEACRQAFNDLLDVRFEDFENDSDKDFINWARANRYEEPTDSELLKHLIKK